MIYTELRSPEGDRSKLLLDKFVIGCIINFGDQLQPVTGEINQMGLDLSDISILYHLNSNVKTPIYGGFFMFYQFSDRSGIRLSIDRSRFILTHHSIDIPENAKLLRFWCYFPLKTFYLYLYHGDFLLVEYDGDQLYQDFEDSINRVRSCRLSPDDLPY